MHEKRLTCIRCKSEYPIENSYLCSNCGGILDVTYEYPKDLANIVKNGSFFNHLEKILPLEEGRYISIGQGNTPLVQSLNINKVKNLGTLFLKCEYLNPTGSFKDRPVSVGISVAKSRGETSVVVASSGNGAASVAAFAARANIRAIIIVPQNTPEEKVRQTLMYGGQVIKVPGPYSDCFKLGKEISEKYKIMNLTSTFINPYMLEGDKVIAYELLHQMPRVPDVIFVPIGAGPLLVGIYKGYKELFNMGLITTLPKMVGVQAEGCNPIARAYEQKKHTVECEKYPQTIAGGISDGLVGYTQDGEYVLQCIEESGGWAISCNDDELLEMQYKLASLEGIFVEPSSAISIAGIKKSIELTLTDEKATHLALLTGSGLKDMSVPLRGKPVLQVDNIESLKGLFEKGDK